MDSFQVTSQDLLLPFLLKTLKKQSRTRVKDLLSEQKVSVNGKTVTQFNFPLAAGDKVAVEFGKKIIFGRGTPRRAPTLKIVYEDDSIVVIDKPAGLLTVATDKIKDKTAYFKLNECLKEADPSGRERIFIVHRLDRDTSGLLVFARSREVQQKLQENWEKVEKRYYAVVEGAPSNKEDVIESYLHENKFQKVYSGEDNRYGKYAATAYRVIRSNKKYSLLEITPKTGRKNQIRVHLSDIGHPIAGDEKYGAATNPIRRLALHAFLLSFPHPVTEKPMKFEIPPPPILEKII